MKHASRRLRSWLISDVGHMRSAILNLWFSEIASASEMKTLLLAQHFAVKPRSEVVGSKKGIIYRLVALRSIVLKDEVREEGCLVDIQAQTKNGPTSRQSQRPQPSRRMLQE